MARRHLSVTEAYITLGVEEGASLEQVKTCYKQQALRSHPDKNPDDPDATAQFQRISEAYNTLLKYLTSPPPSRPHFEEWYDPSDDEYDDSEYDYDGFECCYDSDSEDWDEKMDYYKALYEEFEQAYWQRRATQARQSHRTHAYYYASRPSEASESPEESQARMRRVTEEQRVAEERRKREAAVRKARFEEEREAERKAAEERQKAKASSKKAQAAASKQKAKQAAQSQKERSQKLRSETFAAARVGDSAKVRKGVWEDGVDAAGGEVVLGSEEFVTQKPKDGLETLMHITAARGDVELLSWLDAHSADPEERNSMGYTAFHIALQAGHLSVLQYFFSSYPPADSDSRPVYNAPAPPGKSLLFLALDARDPEMVWQVLEKKLSTSNDLSCAWSWVASLEGQQDIMSSGKGKPEERYEDIKTLLMTFGGFTPPPTPKQEMQEERIGQWEEKQESANMPKPLNGKLKAKKPQRSHRHAPSTSNNIQAHATSPNLTGDEPDPQSQRQTPAQEHNFRPFARGRGRGGRGRGYGGGRGRGRGRGGPPFPS